MVIVMKGEREREREREREEEKGGGITYDEVTVVEVVVHSGQN